MAQPPPIFCGSCGAPNPQGAHACGNCGRPLAGAVPPGPPAAAAAPPPPAYPPPGYAAAPAYPQGYPAPYGYAPATPLQVAQAAPHKTGHAALWIVLGGALLFFMFCMAAAAILLAPHPGGNGKCPPKCAPPPRQPALSAPHTYTSSKLGWSVDYYDPSEQNASAFQVSGQSDNSIQWNLGGLPIAVTGEPASGRSAQKVVEDYQASKFPDLHRVYDVPGAEIGYQPGYGAVYDGNLTTSSGRSIHVRVVVMAAVRNGVAVEAIGVGKYIENTPQNFGHTNPASTVAAIALGPITNSVRWKGDQPIV